MTLIDEKKAEQFYSLLKKGIEIAGGSVANSTVGFALLSGNPAFIGKTKYDRMISYIDAWIGKILQIVDADFSLSWLVSNYKRKDIPLCHHR